MNLNTKSIIRIISAQQRKKIVICNDRLLPTNSFSWSCSLTLPSPLAADWSANEYINQMHKRVIYWLPKECVANVNRQYWRLSTRKWRTMPIRVNQPSYNKLCQIIGIWEIQDTFATETWQNNTRQPRCRTQMVKMNLEIRIWFIWTSFIPYHCNLTSQKR